MKAPIYHRISRNERIPTGHRYIDYQDVLMMMLLFGVGSFIVGFTIFHQLPMDWAGLPLLPSIDFFHLTSWYQHLTPQYQGRAIFELGSSAVCSVIGLIGGIYLGITPKETEIHQRGRRLLDGPEALKAMNGLESDAISRTGQGIDLHPSLPIALERETRHFMLVGAPGGGKTQTLHGVLGQIFARNDKLVLYDTKGDFTAAYPDALLIAPWDSRSPPWNIAKDCRTDAQARELAHRFISDTKEPMWADGTRAILTALIIKLQTEKGVEWTWQDLASLISLASQDSRTLEAAVTRYNPSQSGVVLGGESSQTVRSFMITLGASAALIAQLAVAWKNSNQGVSFTDWLHHERPKYRQIILQGDGRYESLAKAYISSILSLLTQEIQSPAFSDSSSRKIWFILDEAPTLGKVDIFPLITVGRSKGIRVIAAFQDQSQIKEVFGNNVASTWSTSAGTMIIFKMNRGDTANWIAEDLIGEHTVLRDQVSTSYTRDGKTSQRSQISVDIPLLHPSQLETELGPSPEGVRGLVLGFGDIVGRIAWPYYSVPNLRPKQCPATWTLPRSFPTYEETIEKLHQIADEHERKQQNQVKKTRINTKVQHQVGTNSAASDIEKGEEELSAQALSYPNGYNTMIHSVAHTGELLEEIENINREPMGTEEPTLAINQLVDKRRRERRVE